MKNKPTISLILDRRRMLASGKYPIRLQATFQKPGGGWLQKRYPTGYEVSEREFEQIMDKPRVKELQDIRSKIRAMEAKALGILDKHEYLNEEMFTRLYQGQGLSSVSALFGRYIKELDQAGRVGNRIMYNTALNSITAFAGEVSFMEITLEWLNRYTTWMKKARKVKDGETEKTIPGKSITTIAMYLRCLRKIYNDAIYMKYVSADYYPFGKRQYSIQEQKNPKTALSWDQKNQVLEFETDNAAIRQAVDMWIFSYLTNGIAMVDICHMKNKDIKDGILFYNRQKTIRTSRTLLKIEVPLRPEALAIIARHGRKSLDPGEYVFPVLDKDLSPSQAKYKIQDFIDRTNKNLRPVAVKLKFNFKFTTYTARHTYANIALQKGHSTEEIKESMGHGSVKTTEIYTAGFAIEAKRRRGMDL